MRSCDNLTEHHIDDSLKEEVLIKNAWYFSCHSCSSDAGPVDGGQAVDVVATLGKLAVPHGESQGAELLHLWLQDRAGGVRALPQETEPVLRRKDREGVCVHACLCVCMYGSPG